jgi:hypothetical protein
MLLHIDGEVIEIRPGEFFESKNLVDSRYLEIINKPEQKKKKGRPSKHPTVTQKESNNGSNKN